MTTTGPPHPAGDRPLVSLGLLAAQIAGLFVVFALALFLPAGTADWPAAWLYLGLFFGFVVALSAWLLRHDPGLLAERMTGLGRADQQAWDKVFYALANLLFFGWFILMALDAARFRWSQLPPWLHFSGGLLLVVSFWLFFLTFRENAFLSPAVRIQTDRGQTVVSTGPYRFVRHPMYAAFVVFALGTPLLLGSWFGLPFGALIVAAVARRAVLEERVLRRALPGYAAYLARVRYRLIPGVW